MNVLVLCVPLYLDLPEHSGGYNLMISVMCICWYTWMIANAVHGTHNIKSFNYSDHYFPAFPCQIQLHTCRLTDVSWLILWYFSNLFYRFSLESPSIKWVKQKKVYSVTGRRFKCRISETENRGFNYPVTII